MRECLSGNITRSGLAVVMLLVLSACGSADNTDPQGNLGIGEVTAATVSNEVADPSQMAVGDIYQVMFHGDELTKIDMSGVSADSSYLLGVMNLNPTGSQEQVYLSNSQVDPAAALSKSVANDPASMDESMSPSVAFELQRRNWEMALAAEKGSEFPQSISKAVNIEDIPQIGDVEDFRVLQSLGSMTNYVEVNAELRCVGDRLLWYIDTEYIDRGSPGSSEEQIQTLCDSFNSMISAEESMLGEMSDVDGNGRLVVLMTPQVNRLGTKLGGLVTGFFLAGDLQQRSNTNQTSNQREIIYTMTPDPSGEFGARIGSDLTWDNLLPAVLPHELQHAISYNQHVILRGGTPEEAWLNEGLSHLTEDLLGKGIENPSRYDLYLQHPEAYSIVGSVAPGLAERGGIFLFLRYLYEQSPDGSVFLRRLLQTKLTGVANIEQAFASADPDFDQFPEFFLRWGSALAINGAGLTLDQRYRYKSRVWEQENGVYSGVCTICRANDNRGTVINGITPRFYSGRTSANLLPTSMTYYEVSAGDPLINLWAKGRGLYGATLIRLR